MRTEALKLLAQIAVGDNPQEAKKKARREAARMQTLQAVFDHYKANHLQKYCSQRSVQNSKYEWDPVPFKGQKLSSITMEQVRNLHRDLGEARGPYMANRVVGLLRVLFNYAADELGYTGPNPVRLRKTARGDRRRNGTIALFPEKGRERFIQPDELPRFFDAVKAEEDEDFKDLVLMLLFTGAHRGNVQAMKWEDISLERGVWTIPHTKNGDSVKIALSPWAMAVLRRRATSRKPEVEWVFPARRAKSGHMQEPKKLWWALRDKAGLPDLKMHDLRRTLATYQRTTGATLEMIGASLGHRSRVATEIYARVDLNPVRQAVTTATRALLEAGDYDLPVIDQPAEPAEEQAAAEEVGNGD